MSKLYNLNRYLINFSYIGTNFSGVARQTNQHTVSNVIEETFQQLSPTVCELKSNFFVSSRTDAGVHALSNTAHCDLIIPGDSTCSLIHIQKSLNDLFIQNDHLIKINGIRKVAANFVSRHAKARTYFYRLGLVKDGKRLYKEFVDIQKVQKALYSDTIQAYPHFSIVNFVNSIEKDFITEIKEPFDYELFVKALDAYNGQHNFSAFTTADGRLEMNKQQKIPIKVVRIKVCDDKTPFLSSYVHELDDRYRLIEVEITAGSFLYKMIRKMVGAAVDVARGAIQLKQLEEMMLCPADFYGPKSTTILQPNGLFLKKVHYETEYFS